MVPWEFKHSFGNGKRILTGEEGSVEEGGPRRSERALECEPGPFGMECGWRVRQLEGWGGHLMLLLKHTCAKALPEKCAAYRGCGAWHP